MNHVDARHALQELGRQMRWAAVARGCVVELPGLGFGQCDEFLYGPDRDATRYCEDVLRVRNLCNRREVLDRIVLELLMQTGIDRKAAAHHDETVTVRRRLCRNLGSNISTCAGSVVYDDLLPQALADLNAHN